MLSRKRSVRSPLDQLVSGPHIRTLVQDGQTLYSAADVAAALATSNPIGDADACWLDLAGVMRMVQRSDAPIAQRIREWLIATAIERIEEADDPELALVRTRQDYEHQGYSRQWIDQRMRCVSARHELTGEWYRRGVRDSDQFRALTNELMQAAFGMDVESYRCYKGLFGTRHNLRDHMTDLELSLTSLAETTAVELHRQRHSSGFDALLLDMKDAGRVIARTRDEIQSQSGRPVVSASNHVIAARPKVAA